MAKERFITRTIKTEEKAVVKIVGITEKETLYKVKEDFMKIAQVVE